MAEADAAHPWDGQNARAQHEHDGAAPQWPGHHDSHDGHPGRTARPGSDGERVLQRRLRTSDRAERFYDEQVLDHLNERMREFVQRQEMFFLATSDSEGECDSSFRAGPPGFLQVIGERTLVYPEYRGNGVHASLGNIEENPHLGIMLIDFTRARIGLHINGSATIVEDDEMRALHPHLPQDPVPGRRAQLWVRVEVEEAYIHCAKHIPQLQRAPKRTARDWGTDDYKRKGGDFFGAARDARDRVAAAELGGGSAREHVPDVPAALDAPEVPVAEPSTVARERAEASSYDELTGYGREEAHSPSGYALGEPSLNETDAASGTPAADGTPAVSEISDALLGTESDEVWQVPEMPPPPKLPYVPLGQGESRAQADSASAMGAGSVWPAASSSTAADGASGAIAARGGVSSALHVGAGTDPAAWRQEAERALAEAQRRGAESERNSFQGWFG